MLSVKNGQLKGVKYVVSENGTISSAMVVKFKNGLFFVSLPDKDRSTFIRNFVEKFDLGIANMNTFFNYVDLRHNVAIKFNLCWDYKNFVASVVDGLDKDVAKDILDISSAIEYNCDIINYGLSLNMNSLKISGDIPEEVKKYEIEEIFEEEAEAPTDFTGKDISLLLRKEKVALRDDLIIGLSNSWVNEGWNGPQSFGGYLQLDGYRFCDKGNAYYDFTFTDLKDILKDKDHCFDENTTISLEGSQETGFHIILPLKKRDMLKGIRDSSICTDLVEDVQTLFELKYETHVDYLNRLPNCSLRLETIETIEKYFDEYEELIRKRYYAILGKADILPKPA